MRDAVAVVLKKGEKYLLIRRAKRGRAEDFWCPVTGAVEHGETQQQAVIREAREEIGIKVRPLQKVWECMTDDKGYLLHWWHSVLENAAITINPEEVKEYRWVTYREMLGLDKMFDADRKFFRNIASHLEEP
jgi:8-oxo-dGTP pyrophosphatase MutT (NUDIX family)